MSVPLERVTSSGILPAPWLRQWNEARSAYFYINPSTEPPTRQWTFPTLVPDPNPYGTPPAGPPGAAATAATVVYLPPSPDPASASTEDATSLNTPDALHRAEERGARLAHGLDALHAKRTEVHERVHERVEERVHNVVSAIDDILHREHKSTHAPTPSEYTQTQYRPVTPGYGYSEGGGSTGFTYQNCYDGRSARAQ